MMGDQRVRKQRWTIVCLVVSFFVVGCCWALASPPSSAADDDFHLTSIWCAWGNSETCAITDEANIVRVPEKVVQGSCFTVDTGKDGRCYAALSSRLIGTYRVNPSWGTYPPGYYMAMRAFVGTDVERSVLFMRVANVAIASAFLASLLILTRSSVRRASILAWTIAFSPVAIFFIASTNPSSWTIIGVGTFWAFLLAFGSSARWRSRRAIANLVLAGVAALLALMSRADAAVYLGTSMVAVAILAWPDLRTRMSRHRRITVVAGVLVALVLAGAATNLLRYLQNSLSFPAANLDSGQPNAVIKTLLELPTFLAGVLGGQAPLWSQSEYLFNTGLPGYTSPGFTYGVGWVDVFNPAISGTFVLAAAAGAVFVGFSRYNWRKVVAFVWIVAMLVVQVLAMRGLVEFAAIWFLQPRYVMPIVLVAIGIALYGPVTADPMFARAQRWALVALVSIAASVSYIATLSRYTRGQGSAFSNISADPFWWWNTELQPWILVVVVAVATTVFVVAGTSYGREVFPKRNRATRVRHSR